MSEVQVGPDGRTRHRNDDGDWETDSDWETPDEESEEEADPGPLSPFFHAETYKFPHNVGMPNFYYNGEVYYWTDRNLRVFKALVLLTLECIRDQAGIPPGEDPDGWEHLETWENWEFRFDQTIPVQETFAIQNNLQRRLDWVQWYQFGRPPAHLLPPPETNHQENSELRSEDRDARGSREHQGNRPSRGSSVRATSRRARVQPRAAPSRRSRRRKGIEEAEAEAEVSAVDEGLVEAMLRSPDQEEATETTGGRSTGTRSLRPRSSLRLPGRLDNFPPPSLIHQKGVYKIEWTITIRHLEPDLRRRMESADITQVWRTRCTPAQWRRYLRIQRLRSEVLQCRRAREGAVPVRRQTNLISRHYATPPKRLTTLEQEAFLYGSSLRYHNALRERKIDVFWKSIFDKWFLRWPVVPGLIERGLLPPEAANYKFTPEQKRVVNAEMDPIIDNIMETMNSMYEKWIDIKLAEEQKKEWDDFWKKRDG